MKRGEVIGILGTWLVIAGLWQFPPTTEMTNSFFVGIVTAILGLSLITRYPMNGWVSGLFGLWTSMTAFIPELWSGSPLLLNNIISGSFLTISGFGVPYRREAKQSRLDRAA
jgi:hypothetical protein